MNNIPRALVDELITRWSLTKLKMVVVEGPFDQRFLRLTQTEGHCDPALKDLDVWPVDAIEVPADLLGKHGLLGTGAKQRVVAFAREAELTGEPNGFRGVVDKDLDPYLQINHSSPVLLYTDHSCMDSYLWTSEVFHRLLLLFRAEERVPNAAAEEKLLASINSVCADLAAVRIVAATNLELKLETHQSDRPLSLRDGSLFFDMDRYVEQCKPVKGRLPDAITAANQVKTTLTAINALDLLNGHDLTWLLTFVLRDLTKGSRRTVDSETVEGALISFGLLNEHLTRRPMFNALAAWAA